MIKQVTNEKYLQVLGLLTLAGDYYTRLEAVGTSIRNVLEVTTADEDVSGVGSPEHINDALYSRYSVDELLSKLGLSKPSCAPK